MTETNERPNPAGISEEEVTEEIKKMDLPSNSNKSRKLKKVVNGAKERKKTMADRLRETFIAEDIADVKNYIFFDVIVPAVKDTVVNVIVNGINAVVYGDTRVKNSRFSAPYSNRNTQSYSSYGSHTPYSSMARNKPPEGSFRRGYSRKEPIVETKYDADLVLDELNGVLYEYDQATVGDLYDLLGFETENTDYKWGWVDLSTATVRKVSEGWLIDLPRPTRL